MPGQQEEPWQAPAAPASLQGVDEVAGRIREASARALNAEQRLAVASVLAGAGGGTPFALFGPPGTGKTVTLVECALQAGHPLPLRILPSLPVQTPGQPACCSACAGAAWSSVSISRNRVIVRVRLPRNVR